jgi:hypothetical protein
VNPAASIVIGSQANNLGRLGATIQKKLNAIKTNVKGAITSNPSRKMLHNGYIGG